jgi:hypothetical protein
MAITGNSPHHGGAMSMADFTAWAGIGRTTAWKEIKEGRLRAIKVSARTLITFADASRWLENCPDARSSDSSHPTAAHSRPMRLVSDGK